MALAEAILGAVTAISQTVSTFVGAGAQKYGFQKGMEAGTVQYEQAKTLSSYDRLNQNNQMIMYLVLGVMAAILIAVFIKRRQ